MINENILPYNENIVLNIALKLQNAKKKERKVKQGVVEGMGLGWTCGPRGRGFLYADG